MKIMHEVENYTINQDIYFAPKVAVTFPLNLEAIAHKEITIAESLVIPYRDSQFSKAINSLAYDVAANTNWLYPDEDNIKVSIVVDMMSDEGFKPSLVIEVQPPHYKSDDIDGEFIDDEIVASAEAFHQRGGCAMCENIGVYPIEFEGEEEQAFMWFLVQHCHLVALGGSYK